MKTISRLMLVISIALMFLVNTQLFMSCSASIRVPGIAPGQFLHYSINTTVIGNDTELMPHIQQVQGFGNVTVMVVSGANVTFQQVFYNATYNQSIGIVQGVENGQMNGSMSQFATVFIAANLSAGDQIYIGTGNPYINETISEYYLGRQLETNHLIVSYNVTNTDQYGYLTNLTMLGQVYWERKTGIMLDYNIEEEFNRSDGVGGVLLTHAQMRVLILLAIPPPPIVPEFPSLLILPLFMTITLLAVIAYKRKRTKYSITHNALCTMHLGNMHSIYSKDTEHSLAIGLLYLVKFKNLISTLETWLVVKSHTRRFQSSKQLRSCLKPI